MKKKTWSRKNIVTDVGPCKYCNVMISNTDSFVALVKELKPVEWTEVEKLSESKKNEKSQASIQ